MNTQATNPTPERPRLKLSGTDGNVFAIIGNVSRALKAAGQSARAREFTQRAFAARSYEEVLVLLHDYVDAR